jgi:hypothetical protein
MKTIVKRFLLIFSTGALLSACYVGDPVRENFSEEGYRPVYAEPSISEIKMLPPRAVKNPGKIYLYGSYLLVNEVNRGIHIFNNSDPSNPVPVGFAEIFGNNDMAVKDNVLYADHAGNLVALKTENFSSFEKLGELPLSAWLLGVPPPPGAYFECVEKEKGLVVSWKKSTLQNPKCYAFGSTGN